MPERIVPLPDTLPHMRGAWAACLHWAIGDPKVLAAFREATGVPRAHMRKEAI